MKPGETLAAIEKIRVISEELGLDDLQEQVAKVYANLTAINEDTNDLGSLEEQTTRIVSNLTAIAGMLETQGVKEVIEALKDQ